MRRRRRELLAPRARARGRDRRRHRPEPAPLPGRPRGADPGRARRRDAPAAREARARAAAPPRRSSTRAPSGCRWPTARSTRSSRRSCCARSTTRSARCGRSPGSCVPAASCSSSSTCAPSPRGSPAGRTGSSAVAALRLRLPLQPGDGELMRACGFELDVDEAAWRAMPPIVRPLVIGRARPAVVCADLFSTEAAQRARRAYDAAADHYDGPALAFWSRAGTRTVERLGLPAGVRPCWTHPAARAHRRCRRRVRSARAVRWSPRTLAEGMLALARAKAKGRRPGQRRVPVRATCAALGYPDESFDAVQISVFGIFFVPDMLGPGG